MRFSTVNLLTTTLTLILLDVVWIAYTGEWDPFYLGISITFIFNCLVRGIVWCASKKRIYIRKYEYRISAIGGVAIWMIIAFCYPIGSTDFYFSLGVAAIYLLVSLAMALAIFRKKNKKKA